MNSYFKKGDIVKCIDPLHWNNIKKGGYYKVVKHEVYSDDFGRWWLEPRQVDVVASTGGKALENAADEGTSIDVDKLIEAIKNYGWTVNETISYLEGFKEGVNTL